MYSSPNDLWGMQQRWLWEVSPSWIPSQATRCRQCGNLNLSKKIQTSWFCSEYEANMFHVLNLSRYLKRSWNSFRPSVHICSHGTGFFWLTLLHLKSPFLSRECVIWQILWPPIPMSSRCSGLCSFHRSCGIRCFILMSLYAVPLCESSWICVKFLNSAHYAHSKVGKFMKDSSPKFEVPRGVTAVLRLWDCLAGLGQRGPEEIRSEFPQRHAEGPDTSRATGASAVSPIRWQLIFTNLYADVSTEHEVDDMVQCQILFPFHCTVNADSVWLRKWQHRNPKKRSRKWSTKEVPEFLHYSYYTCQLPACKYVFSCRSMSGHVVPAQEIGRKRSPDYFRPSMSCAR